MRRFRRVIVLGVLLIAQQLPAYYNATAGRFLSRDPIEERGGLGLYGFVANGSINRIDVLGLEAAEPTPANTFSVTATQFEMSGDGGIRGGVLRDQFKFELKFQREQGVIAYDTVKLSLRASWAQGDVRAKRHETKHVQDNWQIWNLIHKEADRFKRPCATAPEFECFNNAWKLELEAYKQALMVLSTGRHGDVNDPIMVYPQNDPANPDKTVEGQKQLYQKAREVFRTKKQTALTAYFSCRQKFENPKLTFTQEVVRRLKENLDSVQAQVDSILSERAGSSVPTFPGVEQFR